MLSAERDFLKETTHNKSLVILHIARRMLFLTVEIWFFVSWFLGDVRVLSWKIITEKPRPGVR